MTEGFGVDSAYKLTGTRLISIPQNYDVCERPPSLFLDLFASLQQTFTGLQNANIQRLTKIHRPQTFLNAKPALAVGWNLAPG
jgi:hypothetical protein